MPIETSQMQGPRGSQGETNGCPRPPAGPSGRQIAVPPLPPGNPKSKSQSSKWRAANFSSHRICRLHGAYSAHIRRIFGAYSAHIFGAYSAHIWRIFGAYLAHIWRIFLYSAHIRRIFGAYYFGGPPGGARGGAGEVRGDKICLARVGGKWEYTTDCLPHVGGKWEYTNNCLPPPLGLPQWPPAPPRGTLRRQIHGTRNMARRRWSG